DFSQLPQCEDGQHSDQCFTSDQIDIIREIYTGPEINGTLFYPGFPLGCENEKGSWMTWIVGPDPGTMQLNFPNLHYAFGTELCKYLIFNDPDWDYSTYDFSHYNEDTRYAAAYLDATSTDYSAFEGRGGKLIFYHGWNDPALSAYTTIEHFEAVRKKNPGVDEFMRLYLLPGVLHCGGGPGPDQADWLELVRKWVENDQPPGKVVLSKVRDGQVQMTRPVFPYPSTAKYVGKGDPLDGNNFVEKKP
ncbi:MAG: tannase/feruloyl esterase family alpha/beta hydrolase, partial [Saprospiraceae bacterium]|nr:tannase/feruloyl esterase family alpha/beta hydrolase [Saprospiraceae bacterium]